MQNVAQAVRKLGQAEPLDPLADNVQRFLRPLFASTLVKNALSGFGLVTVCTQCRLTWYRGIDWRYPLDIMAPGNRATGPAATWRRDPGSPRQRPRLGSTIGVDVYEDGRRHRPRACHREDNGLVVLLGVVSLAPMR